MRIAVILLSMFILTGCYETKLDYTLNPDGSGKVIVQITAESMDMGTKKSSNALNDFAKGVIEKTKGVETWKDVEVKELPGSKNYFKGTAYFKDLRTVKFQSYSLLDSMDFSVNKKGDLVLTIVQKDDGKGMGDDEKTNETIEQKIERQKTEYKQIKGMLSAILGTMKTEASFQLPGDVGSSSNFKTDAQGNPSIMLDGSKILEALDKLMTDEAFLRKQAQKGGSIKKGPPAGEEFNEMLFGEKGPVKLSTKGKLKARFDYAKESADAAAAYPGMIAALGLNASGSGMMMAEKEMAPMKAGTFTDVKIVRATLADMYDPDYELFGTEQYYTIAFLGMLPGSVVTAEQATLETAIGDNGENLVSEDEWQRSTTYVRVSDKKNALMWDLNLNMPGPGVKGLKVVSGTVTAMSASGMRAVKTKAIRFSDLKSGVPDLTISGFSVENNELTLEFKMQKDMIKKITITDASDNEIETFWSSSYGDDQSCTISLSSSSGDFPDRGKIKCEIYDGIERLSIPFMVKNVNLLGRPVK